MNKIDGKTKEEWEHEFKIWNGVNPHLTYAARKALDKFDIKSPEEVSKAEDEFYKLNKDEQISMLEDYGLSAKDIKELNSERKRVEKLLSLK